MWQASLVASHEDGFGVDALVASHEGGFGVDQKFGEKLEQFQARLDCLLIDDMLLRRFPLFKHHHVAAKKAPITDGTVIIIAISP